jgi:secondary thiamine-phosphate synthase enzyme
MQRFTLELETDGNNQVVNLETMLTERLKGIRGSGVLMLFVVGSTAGLTTIELEPGLVKHDIPALLQRLVPDDACYQHESTWNDDNGHSHLRAMLVGASVNVPFADGKLLTGTFQQVVLIDFDTRHRRRTVIVTVVG